MEEEKIIYTYLLVTKNHKKYVGWSKHYEIPFNSCKNIEWIRWDGELPLSEIEGFELMKDKDGNLIEDKNGKPIEDITKPKKCYVDIKNKTLHKVFGDVKPFFKVEKVVA
jgi:hypothetical protein